MALCLAVMLLHACGVMYAGHAEHERVTASNIMAACDDNCMEFIM